MTFQVSRNNHKSLHSGPHRRVLPLQYCWHLRTRNSHIYSCIYILVHVALYKSHSPTVQAVSEGSSSDQKLQCYACGLPSINPEKDLDGSYGAKTYNHTCDEAFDASAAGDEIALRRFLRTCPAGVQSCFGSDGYYNHEDDNATIEIGETCL